MLDNFPGGHQEECKEFWPINALKCLETLQLGIVFTGAIKLLVDNIRLCDQCSLAFFASTPDTNKRSLIFVYNCSSIFNDMLCFSSPVTPRLY